MAYDDTKWGGFAKIIVDTSTMSVGDTVRVKSMTTGTNYDKQVATVGTPLIWDKEIFKDYVKICMVQTINDTPTEVGGVYRELDYGETAYINVLDKTTLGGIQGILNAHQEGSLLAIGDEVDITVSGSPVTFQVGAINLYDSHEVIFVAKHIQSLSETAVDYTSSNLRTSAQAFYSSIADKDKQFIKLTSRKCRRNADFANYDDYVWIAGTQEALNQSVLIDGQSVFPIFVTQANRIKTWEGTAKAWWTDDSWSSSGAYSVGSDGAQYNNSISMQLGLVPCFRLTADS